MLHCTFIPGCAPNGPECGSICSTSVLGLQGLSLVLCVGPNVYGIRQFGGEVILVLLAFISLRFWSVLWRGLFRFHKKNRHVLR